MNMDWEAFARRYRPLLERSARVRLRSAADAEEVAQRVLARLASDGGKALDSLDKRAPLDSWLTLVALREARDFARGEARERSRALHARPREGEVPSPLADLVRAEDEEGVRKALFIPGGSRSCARTRVCCWSCRWRS